MALTVTKLGHELKGNVIERRLRLTFDAAYPTGGEAYTAAELGLSILHKLRVPGTSNAGNRLVVDDATNSKVLLYTALGTEAVNGSDQSAISVDVEAIGVGVH